MAPLTQPCVHHLFCAHLFTAYLHHLQENQLFHGQRNNTQDVCQIWQHLLSRQALTTLLGESPLSYSDLYVLCIYSRKKKKKKQIKRTLSQLWPCRLGPTAKSCFAFTQLSPPPPRLLFLFFLAFVSLFSGTWDLFSSSTILWFFVTYMNDFTVCAVSEHCNCRRNIYWFTPMDLSEYCLNTHAVLLSF